MTYTLDTDILVSMERRYPREFFRSLWQLMENAVANGEICLCEVSRRELERREDNLASWVKRMPEIVCKATEGEIATVANIAKKHPEWVQVQKNHSAPFVIAHAKAYNLVVVTEENHQSTHVIDRRQKIPNIAGEHGVQCVTFFELLRARGWKF